MRYLYLFLTFLLSFNMLNAQFSIEWVDDTNVASVPPNSILLTPNGIQAVKTTTGIKAIYSSLKKELIINTDVIEDESFMLYPEQTGAYRIRTAISNFESYDANHRLLATLSNSSGSSLGEGVSTWHTNLNESLWIVANPLIKTPEGEGSAAYIWKGKERLSLYFSSDKRLIDVEVAEDGLMVAVSYGNESGYTTSIFDRQANELLSIKNEGSFDLKGSKISMDGEYITLFSSRRAKVYGIPSGKSYGSTSVRNTIVDAALDTKNGLKLYVLMGEMTSSHLNAARVQMVDLKKRKVNKVKEVQDIIRLSPSLNVELVLDNNQITSQGLTKRLVIK